MVAVHWNCQYVQRDASFDESEEGQLLGYQSDSNLVIATEIWFLMLH